MPMRRIHFVSNNVPIQKTLPKLVLRAFSGLKTLENSESFLVFENNG